LCWRSVRRGCCEWLGIGESVGGKGGAGCCPSDIEGLEGWRGVGRDSGMRSGEGPRVGVPRHDPIDDPDCVEAMSSGRRGPKCSWSEG